MISWHPDRKAKSSWSNIRVIIRFNRHLTLSVICTISIPKSTFYLLIEIHIDYFTMLLSSLKNRNLLRLSWNCLLIQVFPSVSVSPLYEWQSRQISEKRQEGRTDGPSSISRPFSEKRPPVSRKRNHPWHHTAKGNWSRPLIHVRGRWPRPEVDMLERSRGYNLLSKVIKIECFYSLLRVRNSYLETI